MASAALSSFSSSRLPGSMDPSSSTLPAKVGVMLSTKSPWRIMVAGSRLNDADTMVPVARTMSFAIPWEKAGSLFTLTPGVPASFFGSPHKVTFIDVKLVAASGRIDGEEEPIETAEPLWRHRLAVVFQARHRQQDTFHPPVSAPPG